MDEMDARFEKLRDEMTSSVADFRKSAEEQRRSIESQGLMLTRLEGVVTQLTELIKGNRGLYQEIDEIHESMGKLDGRVSSLEFWKIWVMGAAAVIAAGVPFVLDFLKQ